MGMFSFVDHSQVYSNFFRPRLGDTEGWSGLARPQSSMSPLAPHLLHLDRSIISSSCPIPLPRGSPTPIMYCSQSISLCLFFFFFSHFGKIRRIFEVGVSFRLNRTRVCVDGRRVIVGRRNRYVWELFGSDLDLVERIVVMWFRLHYIIWIW